jgi:hypothetical protein
MFSNTDAEFLDFRWGMRYTFYSSCGEERENDGKK